MLSSRLLKLAQADPKSILLGATMNDTLKPLIWEVGVTEHCTDDNDEPPATYKQGNVH